MPDENQKDQDQIRLENEIKKINLELNHGMESFVTSGDLPPEIEAAFLDNVAKFEEGYSDAKQIALYDFIGRPSFQPTKEVENPEAEIARILKILEEKSISIDRPDHLTPLGYYNFLTNDLFQHQMVDFSVEGMIHGFLYNEFRHDGPEFVEEHVEDFLLTLLNLEDSFEIEWLSESCRSEKENMSKEEALNCIHQFRAQYDELIPLAFEKRELSYNNGFMYFIFAIAWTGRKSGEQESKEQEGMGICQLAFEEGEWMIQGVQMPGFQFEKQ